MEMNNIEHDYLKLLHDVLKNGELKNGRNGQTRSVFGRQIRHDMSLGFPLLTTKKMYWKGIVTELLWFLRGDTNIKFLVDNNCHIWDGDAFNNFMNTSEGDPDMIWNKEQFIHLVKTDDEFAKTWGELGPIYGKQWRSWGKMNVETKPYIHNGATHFTFDIDNQPIDQIQNLINDLKTNPDSRRLMVSAWNVGEIEEMTLPPCHYGFQVYTRELDETERVILMDKKLRVTENLPPYYTEDEMIKNNIPKRAISLMWNQRSVDTPLGLPFNIASYALLLELLAMETNMIPDQLIGNLGDCHIYLNQIDGVKEQLTRSPLPLGKLVINDEFWNPDAGIFEQQDMRPEDFRIDGYQSHPTIKAPLSN